MRMCYLVLLILLILVYFASTAKRSQQNFNSGSRFKSIKCEADNKTIFLKYCYLKPISRQTVLIKLGVKFLVPYTNFYVQMILNYRYGNVFRQAIDAKPQEWCSVMDGKSTHPYLKYVINQLKTSTPELFHKCPYEGELDIQNMKIDNNSCDNYTQMVPTGTYRSDVIIFRNQTQTMKLMVVLDVKSSLKESFG